MIIMGVCPAVNCGNNSTSSRGKSFFSFPMKNKILTKIWVMKMRRKDFLPNKHSRLCSDHFDPKFIIQGVGFGKPKLKPDAIPTIFDFSSSMKAKNRKLIGAHLKSKFECKEEKEKINSVTRGSAPVHINVQPTVSIKQGTFGAPSYSIIDVTDPSPNIGNKSSHLEVAAFESSTTVTEDINTSLMIDSETSNFSHHISFIEEKAKTYKLEKKVSELIECVDNLREENRLQREEISRLKQTIEILENIKEEIPNNTHNTEEIIVKQEIPDNTYNPEEIIVKQEIPDNTYNPEENIVDRNNIFNHSNVPSHEVKVECFVKEEEEIY